MTTLLNKLLQFKHPIESVDKADDALCNSGKQYPENVYTLNIDDPAFLD